MRPYLLLLVWLHCMVLSFMVSKDAVQYADPFTLTGLRFVLAAILLTLIGHRYLSGIRLAHWRLYGLITLPLVAFFVLMFIALQYTAAINTSAIYTLVPTVGLLTLALSLGRWPAAAQWLALGLGLAGAWLALLGHPTQSLGSLNQGDALFALACVCLITHVQLVQRFGRALPSLQATWLILWVGTLLMVPAVVLFGQPLASQWQAPGLWLDLALLTVFATLMTFWLQNVLIKSLGAQWLLMTTYWIPILVALYGLQWHSWLPLAFALVALANMVMLIPSQGRLARS